MEAREFAVEMNERLSAAGEKEMRPNDMGKLLKKYTVYLTQLGIKFVRNRSGYVTYEFKKIPIEKEPSVTVKAYCEDCEHHTYNPFEDTHTCAAHGVSFDSKGQGLTICNTRG